MFVKSVAAFRVQARAAEVLAERQRTALSLRNACHGRTNGASKRKREIKLVQFLGSDFSHPDPHHPNLPSKLGVLK